MLVSLLRVIVRLSRLTLHGWQENHVSFEMQSGGRCVHFGRWRRWSGGDDGEGLKKKKVRVAVGLRADLVMDKRDDVFVLGLHTDVVLGEWQSAKKEVDLAVLTLGVAACWGALCQELEAASETLRFLVVSVVGS